MALLSWYVLDTQTLLHDQGATFSSVATVQRAVNEARRQCVARTGCVQKLITGQSAFGASAQPGMFLPGAAQPGALPGSFPNAQNFATNNSFQTITGVERYPFQGFANPYLTAQYAGTSHIIDVASISISWAGSVRPSLDYLPWEQLQAYARAYATLVTSYPYYWSTLADGENGELWLFPVPSFAMEMEWNVYAQVANLYSDSDYDAIPPGFSNAIKFGAASLLFLGKQMFAQADIMEERFNSRLGIGAVARDKGKVASWYPA